jgi:hypothetical protein
MKKQSKIKIFSCVTVPFLALIFGCGGNKAVKQNQAMADLNKPIVYEKTGTTQRPAWTNQTTFYEDDVGFHFSGGVMGGSDYALTLRLAKSEAIKNLLESIEIKTRSEFSSVMHGNYGKDGDIGRYVTDAVAWTVENIRVSGIKQQDIYYEQTIEPGTHRVRYNAWVNLNISKADYIKSKTGAAEKLLNKAIRERDEEAKQKALELLERLRTET